MLNEEKTILYAFSIIVVYNNFKAKNIIHTQFKIILWSGKFSPLQNDGDTWDVAYIDPGVIISTILVEVH